MNHVWPVSVKCFHILFHIKICTGNKNQNRVDVTPDFVILGVC